MFYFKSFYALILIFSCLVISIKAQQNIIAAVLDGTVSDENNQVISGTQISVRNLATNQIQKTFSDERGTFHFAYLPAGDYEIEAVQNGFETLRSTFTATVGQNAEIKLSLKVKDVSAQVDVSANTEIIETNRTQISETIISKDIENLPLNGRNFLDLALLVPGVSRTNTGSVQRFAETSAVPGTGISVAGQRNLANSFIVDGLSANDDSVELAGTFYSQEVIREFQVLTSGASAEFGRATGGFINIITQSGTNDFHGKIYGFLRSQNLDARNPLALSKDPLTQTQYGANVGAPIIKNRAFFFTNFEQTRRHDSNFITISPVSVTVINNRLRSAGYRGQPLQTGLAPGGYNTTNFFARIDHQFNEKNFFTATYNFYGIEALNARTVGGLNAVSRGTNLDNRDHTVNLQNVTTAGSQNLNEARFQFRRSRLAAPAIDNLGPAVNISGIANFGTATSSPTERDIDLYQLTDSFSATRKNHRLKFGAEMIYNRLNIEFPGAITGVYTFTNLANFLSGNYSQFQQAFGAPSQKQNNPNFGFFAQDEWKISKKIIFNLGFRYDLQFLPEPIETDKNNFAPRFGIAYSPDEKTVIRGSFGIYYDRIPTRATSNALQRDGSKYIVAILSRNSPNAPIFPNILAARPASLLTKPSITRIDEDIKNSSSEQINTQIERKLAWDTFVSIGYLYLRGLHIILSRNVNVPRCASAVDPINLCRPDPNFGNISRYESSGDSYYHGLVFSFTKRQGNWMTTRVSYTLSKSIDDTGNFFFSTPQDNFNLRGERGLSDNDQRHHLSVSGTFSVQNSFANKFFSSVSGNTQISYIFSYASQLPFNILAGSDLNADSNNNDRPPGIGRNTGRGFDFTSFDLRVARRLKLSEKFNLELLAEGFNLLNRANYSVPNNTITAATFRQPTAAFDPRQIQLGFRLNF